jgi:hypothetical protein
MVRLMCMLTYLQRPLEEGSNPSEGPSLLQLNLELISTENDEDYVFTFFPFAPSVPEAGHRKLWDLREAIHSDSDYECTLPL